MWWLVCLAALARFSNVESAGAGAARLVCYAGNSNEFSFSECTHLVYNGDARGEKLDGLLKEYRKNNPKLKIILRANEIDKDLKELLKSKHVQGLEIHDAHRTLNKTKVSETVDAAREAIKSSGGGPLFLALPAHPELLAKYYELRGLMKKVDLLVVQTHALGQVKKMTYHPSRLSGLWDMMNTDSVVDLVVGLGVPASKVIISLPATAKMFTLQNETLSTPGSPTVDDEPKEIGQSELCRMLQKGRWTIERDQDLSAPYAFKDKTWISFEDASSVDVKGKYARVRGLAGLALVNADKDQETPCGATIKESLAKVLNQQSRAPRAAVLRSLEHEILSAPGGRVLDALQVSPYRITQVVDSDGVIHSIREDTRTEFSCSRQGYFVHPRSCARFYRCVKFDQLSPDYTVFEFDCPAGLAFDSRYEVCVWPGSLPHSQACPGSSEIAPVPHTRFVCPDHEGYYADPENCRWFFACLDHGKAPLTAYEFRCPFGLGFDAARLKCDWPWLVPACGNIARYEAEAHGFSAALLTGPAGFHGQTADSVNIAAHQSLVSGASLNNLVGIQGSFLSNEDALDSNFIASQELTNEGVGDIRNNNADIQYQSGGVSSLAGHPGLVQPARYNDDGKYSSGSLILDDYRLPTGKENGVSLGNKGVKGLNTNSYSNAFISNDGQGSYKYDNDDQSGAYIHDPSGDYAEPYKHIGSLSESYKHESSPAVPYIHDDSKYRQSADYYDYGRYSAGNAQGDLEGKYVDDNSGKYVHDNTGSYIESTSAYRDNEGKYLAGVYRADGHLGSLSNGNSYIQQGGYSAVNNRYESDSKAYTGASHTLTAGAINVGLVGKTTLVDAEYIDKNNYRENNANAQSHAFNHNILHQPQVSYVSQPAVSINHVGTDIHNLDTYESVTTPTTSGIPTTITPFSVTTAAPTVSTYKTYVPEASRTSIKQIFGYNDQDVTYVKPVIQTVTPKVEVNEYNQGSINEGASVFQSTSGYDYPKPITKFEDGISYTTATPAVSVSTYKPRGFSHVQQTVHQLQSNGYEYSTPEPVKEEPFRKAYAYTTGTSVSIAQPSVSYTPQSFSHQTIHKVEAQNIYTPSVAYEHKYVTSTPQPAISVSTYEPHVYSQQILHKVDAGRINTYESSGNGYNYEKPSVQLQEGYKYNKPIIKLEEKPTIAQYSTPSSTPAYVQQSYSHQTIHKIETPVQQEGYNYNKPSFTLEEKPVVVQYATPAPTPAYVPQSYSHQTIHKVETPVVVSKAEQGYKYEQPSIQVQEGYSYNKPSIKLEETPLVVQYATPASTPAYVPQSYSHQTIHKVETPVVVSKAEEGYNYEQPSVQVQEGYSYNKPSITLEEKPLVVQYATPAPTPAYVPQSYSHQTIHKVETPVVVSKVDEGYSYERPSVQVQEGYSYNKPSINFEEKPLIVQYSTPAPTPAYVPQSYSHQTIHKIESPVLVSKVEEGYNYNKPIVQEKGYNYNKPSIQLEEGYNYNKPSVQSYSHQALHKVETPVIVSSTALPAITYKQPVTIYHNPILQYTQKATPVAYVKPTVTTYTQTYQPIVQQHQINNVQPIKYESQQSYQLSQEGYSQPEIQRDVELVSNAKAYSDASAVSHQVINHHVAHDTGSVYVSSTPATVVYDTSQKQGYSYKAPEYIPPKFDLKTYSVVSTSQPEIQVNANTAKHYSDASAVSHQVIHQVNTQHKYEDAAVFVSTTSLPVVSEAPKVTYSYKAPEYIPPKEEKQSYSVVSSAPFVQKQVYSKPGIQVNYDKAYSDASVVSHQTINHGQAKYDTGNSALFVSSTSQPVLYESSNVHTYKASEYIPPKVEQQSFSYSYKAPVVQQQVYSQPEIQVDYENYNSNAHAHSDASAVSHQVYHNYNLQKYNQDNVEAVVSTTEAPIVYEAPRIKTKTYKAPAYVPPKTVYQETYSVSTAAPVLQEQTYNEPAVQVNVGNSYSDASVVSRQFYHQYNKQAENNQEQGNYVSSTPSNVVYEESYDASPKYEAPQYIPPKQYSVSSTPGPVVPQSSILYESQNFNDYDNQYIEQYESQKTNVESAKGIETQVTYTQPKLEVVSKITPVITSTYRPRTYSTTSREYLPPTPEPEYNAEEYLPPKVESTYLPPSTTKRPRVQSTTRTYVKSTTYQAPEYLPPSEKSKSNQESYDSSKISYNPYQDYVSSTTTPGIVSSTRKHNIVVETAKASLLGFGTLGPDAGLVTSGVYSSSTPVAYTSTTENYSATPEQENYIEVTSKPAPRRRTKQKMAIVTKINDYNPLIVRKLGAVCSCQSPIVVLKGRRPSKEQAVEDYSDDYSEETGRGDIVEIEIPKKSNRLRSRVKSVTVSPVITSSFNPIIVPDDSFYEDDSEETNGNILYDEYVRSSPAITSTTERVVKIRPRVKAVTVAPTYRTVLLKEAVNPSALVSTEATDSAVESQSFDRYGPGGLRGRDETLQGSIDCKRAGLFRHPKKCNKFYACRWDCTKQRFTLHIFNCPVQLSFDPSLGACNWPSQGPACQDDTLLTKTV